MILREIKSFVRRRRRLSKRESQGMELGWPKFGITVNQPLDLDQCFHRSAPKILEIGFGMGDTLLHMAKQHSECDYLGIEVHAPGVATVMAGIVEQQLSNVRIIQEDAVSVLTQYIPDNTFSRIHIFFPDPWPKLRHHKRRLIQDEFVDTIVQKLRMGGVLHVATDWENYAMQIMRVLSSKKNLQNCSGEHQFADNQNHALRMQTKFEKRGVELGHNVWDMLFRKTHPAALIPRRA